MNIFEKEIMRRVKELDCAAVYRENSNVVSVFFDGNIIAEIRGEIPQKAGELDDHESEIYLHLHRLCGNIANCCAAYEKGEPIKNPNISDGFSVELCSMRRLFKIGKAEMAARYDRKSGFEFVVWSGNENPDFFVSYDNAREKFAVLSGLVDREKIFDDEELQALYYCVYVTLEMNDALNKDMLELLGEVKHKLDIAISKNLSASEGEKYGSAV